VKDTHLPNQAAQLAARLLRKRTGQVISPDRTWRIDGAIETVLRRRGITNGSDILSLLTQPDSAAVERELVDTLLNNESYFFRDRPVFAQLAGQVLPSLCRARSQTRTLRIWSAGCSTGQEPLSLAIMLIEQGLTPANGWNVDLVASDVSHSAIEFARKGLYSRFEIQRGLGVSQMLQHFAETPDGWQASRQLLRMIHYRQANLLGATPAGSPFDLILCRNVMLYLGDEEKRTACERLGAALARDGRLLLGAGEASLERTSGFEPASLDVALYGLVARPLAA